MDEIRMAICHKCHDTYVKTGDIPTLHAMCSLAIQEAEATRAYAQELAARAQHEGDKDG